MACDKPAVGHERQQTLDIVRGIAILLVLAFHLRLATGIAAIDAALLPLVDLGWVGVDLFFVLSGFLVGRMILAGAAAPAGFDRATFFRRRILRLWPVLYLYLAMLVAAGGAEGWRLVWPVMLHVQNYAPHIPSHLWSLAVEEHFYLVAAVALPPLLRRGGARAVAAALAAILVGCLALRPLALWLGETTGHLQWRTQDRADAIAAGVLIACADFHRPALVERALRHRAACLALAATGFALLGWIADERFRYTAGVTIAYVASAALILGLYRAAIPAALRSPARLLAWFGGIAYPLYVFHVSFGRLGDALAQSCGFTAAPAMIACRYAMAIAGATAVAMLVERPIMRLRDSAAVRGRPRPAAFPCVFANANNPQ